MGRGLYYVTFGVMYEHTPHPSVPNAHPESFVVIDAPSELIARRIAHGLTNSRFSMLHTQEEMDRLKAEKDWFPRGEIMRITVKET